jgi:23S rRNA G2069 N7-methylase RlmK/C1962 C5-methylase RlmI
MWINGSTGAIERHVYYPEVSSYVAWYSSSNHQRLPVDKYHHMLMVQNYALAHSINAHEARMKLLPCGS